MLVTRAMSPSTHCQDGAPLCWYISLVWDIGLLLPLPAVSSLYPGSASVCFLLLCSLSSMLSWVQGVGKMKPASHARATTAEIQNQEKRDQRGWGAFGRLQEVMYGKSRDVGKKVVWWYARLASAGIESNGYK